MKKFFVISILAMALTSCSGGRQADAQKMAQQAVIDNIMTRTSIRAYTSDPVPVDVVETLLRAGMAAPSAMNGQPWEFVVINDRDSLDKLAGSLRYARMLKGAPLAIAVCGHPTFTDREGNVRENKFWVDDCSAATENILLAAHALGLGAVWTAAKDDRAAVVREALGIPESVNPLCVIVLGYPAENPQPKDKWKPEKVHWNRY